MVEMLELTETAVGSMHGLTPEECASLLQAAAVCLDHNEHRPGARLVIRGRHKTVLHARWPDVTDQQRVLCAR